ncbi:MAG: phosphate ABC transporter substrate-binding protein [Planctomycetaceae bacterium]|nr:phosphate ABC transporter substrate-binding protein [Planctomycetaceae bacterium]
MSTSTRLTGSHRLAVSTGLLLCCALCGCGNPEGGGDAEAGRIVVTGSSTIAPLMAEIAKRFESRHPGVRVDVQTGGSSRGIADARSGLADLGMASRSLKDDEAELLAFPIATDGVCLIVHADNPIEELTREQVIGIYTGTISNWQAAGGSDAPITVVNKAEGRSTLELFLAHFGLEARQIAADVVIGDNEQGIKTVAGNPHAIGYVSIGTAEHDAAAGVPIRLLSLAGVKARVSTVKSGEFPLSRTLNLVSSSPPRGLVKDLVDFARSAEVHDLIEQLSFVPLVAPEREPARQAQPGLESASATAAPY